MSYECQIIEQEKQPALSIRTRTAVQDLPAVMGGAYQQIVQYLGELGEAPAGAPYGGYFNMDMQDLDVEIGFPVARPLEGKDDIQASSIPGGKQAVCTHIGPYNAIEPAYNALTAFMAEQGVEPTGVAYEFHLNDPMVTPPEELETRVVFPLK